MTRDDVIAAARGWIGTPYVHRAALRGVGADCLGLVRGVFRELTGGEAETPPPYEPLSAALRGEEILIEGLSRNLEEIALGRAAPGDVIAFRLRERGPAMHAGILTGPAQFVHVYGEHGAVETPLGFFWRRRRAAAFRFPGLS